MNETPDYQQDLASIRNLMERSSKFISLSGLSGILAGIYALIGAAMAWYVLNFQVSPINYAYDSFSEDPAILRLFAIAIVVLVASIATGVWLSLRKAKRHDTTFWNETSKRLVVNLAIPLVTGGGFILLMLYHGHYGLVSGACLIFYGLALVNASAHLYEEVRYLGYSELIIGLLACALPGYGLLFWSIGFGAFHVFYGALMFRKYDR